MISSFLTISSYSQEKFSIQSALIELFGQSDLQEKIQLIETSVKKDQAFLFIKPLYYDPKNLDDFEAEYLINLILTLTPLAKNDEEVMELLLERDWKTTDLRRSLMVRMKNNAQGRNFLTRIGNNMANIVYKSKGYPPGEIYREIFMFVEKCKNWNLPPLNSLAFNIIGNLRDPVLTRRCMDIWEEN